MAHSFSARIWFCLTWMLFASSPAWAQALIDGAKKEGQVVFYASMEAVSAQRITAAFEKKYPFIKVDATRIGSERMATRLGAEAQARKVRADVVQQSAFDFYGVLQKGLFESYFSPERSAYPPEYRDEKGFWMMPASTLNVIAYNKKMVAANDVPKSFWDLTEPRWKGQLLMDDNESKWMAGMIQYYGEAKRYGFIGARRSFDLLDLVLENRRVVKVKSAWKRTRTSLVGRTLRDQFALTPSNFRC